MTTRPGSTGSWGPATRSLLRGYLWVTVVSQELVVRLGAADGIEAAGAVAEVRQLPGGGVLLRATRRPEEYDEEVTRRLFLRHRCCRTVSRGPCPGDRPSTGSFTRTRPITSDNQGG